MFKGFHGLVLFYRFITGTGYNFNLHLSLIRSLKVLNRVKTDFCRVNLEIKCKGKTYFYFSDSR